VGVVVVVVGVRGRRVWRKEVAGHITNRVTTGKLCVSNNSIDSSSQWGSQVPNLLRPKVLLPKTYNERSIKDEVTNHN
jgi:hypothetical protein